MAHADHQCMSTGSMDINRNKKKKEECSNHMSCRNIQGSSLHLVSNGD